MEDNTGSINVLRSLPNRTTACHRCHGKKIKCSGGHPCHNCVQAEKGTGCAYPQRNRSVKVSQRYIEGLLEEIDRLKQTQTACAHVQTLADAQPVQSDGVRSISSSPPQTRPQDHAYCAGTEECQGEVDASVSGQAVSSTAPPAAVLVAPCSATISDSAPADDEQRPAAITFNQAPWFDNRNVFQTPVLIGEAVDAAFATRFRQVISNPQLPEPTHLLRVNYANNEALIALRDSKIEWPSLARARFLIEAATRYINRNYYVVDRKSIMEGLLRSFPETPQRESAMHCKYWVLFAIGELCTAKTSVTQSYPGMPYFAQASKMLGHLDERPGTDSIEALLLLSMYSLALNRRYSAYVFSGTAMRSAIVMGLHLNIPESQLAYPAARDSRKKLFWTTYMFDRMWGANLGLPAAIQDDEIEVDLPSVPSPTGSFRVGGGSRDDLQFAYYIANIELTRHLNSVIRSVYRRSHRDDIYLATRVQGCLQDLQSWVGRLPPHLQIDPSAETGQDLNAVSLNLLFYKCVIVSTRPILLHSLRMQLAATRSTRSPSLTSQVPASAAALSEACIRCARHSFQLLAQSWIDGTFITFDCFFTQYLFSSMTILAISSILGRKDASADQDSFEEASRLLKELGEAGNCVAQEYCHHVDAIQAALSDHTTVTVGPQAMLSPYPTAIATAFHSHLSQNLSSGAVSTTNLPWTDSSLQTLLSQPPLDLHFLEDAVGDRYLQGLYQLEANYET
ncbi:fungal-specific transcription factor domain-containing protein [Xylaria telfairii]|nr:fungal-specific transcription factor domain-containing protein [Xylaria telfairii]